jgi:hypothetical protein
MTKGQSTIFALGLYLQALTGLLFPPAGFGQTAPGAPRNVRVESGSSGLTPIEFYLDPTFSGAGNGSQALPWAALDSTAWGSINAALNQKDVIIYFSARQAGSDLPETYSDPYGLDLNPRVASNYFLTLNGRSKYNTSDSTPKWGDYTGSSKCKVQGVFSQNESHSKRSNIVIDGFTLAADHLKAVAICGDNWTIRNCDVSHSAVTKTSSDGPLFLIVPTSDSQHEGSGQWCPASKNILIEHNTIHDSYGELLYLGGGGCSSPDPTGVSLCNGFPAHDHVTVRNNKFFNGGSRGAQGDGVDVKGGLTNLKIVENEFYALDGNSETKVRAIVQQGSAGVAENNIIEGNYIHDCAGFEDGAIALVDNWGSPNTVEIRNNLITNTNAVGIRVYGGLNIGIYNNTVYKSGYEGIFTGYGNTAPQGKVENNLLIDNNGGKNQVQLLGSMTNSNNGYSNTWSGTCNSCIPNLTSAVFLNAAGGDFHLSSGAPVIDKGVSIATFATDYSGTPRPQGIAWDIGAFEMQLSSP